MRSLLKFLLRFHFFILFLVIESFAIYLLVKYNSYHRSTFINSSNVITGNIYKGVKSLSEYFNLKQINADLNKENQQLRNRLKSSYKSNKITITEIRDSLYQQQYIAIGAKVINNSVIKQNNYLTLNKGKKHGIGAEMAVVGPKGIVGIVKNVSENFASVISVLNTNLRISAKIKKNDYFGSVFWPGKDYTKVKLTEIPSHVNINIGDTIITSGYSTIFPEGELIGFISNYSEKKGGDFYEISVNLSTDFKNLTYVQVIGNLMKKEMETLEKYSKHD